MISIFKFLLALGSIILFSHQTHETWLSPFENGGTASRRFH